MQDTNLKCIISVIKKHYLILEKNDSSFFLFFFLFCQLLVQIFYLFQNIIQRRLSSRKQQQCLCELHLWFEAATGGVLYEKVSLEISQNSQENTCARVLF